MGQNKAADKKIQDYYNLSLNYLESAKISLKQELFEPAMFSAIHALELSLKAALLTKTDVSWNTAVSNGWISDYVFGWDRSGQSYNFADMFMPGHAYWMYAYQPCTLRRTV